MPPTNSDAPGSSRYESSTGLLLLLAAAGIAAAIFGGRYALARSRDDR